jgi:CubicO group peptidase (beta-lactamase class C family)
MSGSGVEQFLEAAVGVVFPAAQLVVVDAGATALDLAVGAASRDTIFDLASLTKPLATAALARTLDLDAAVRDGVTVRHLLAHASGLPAWKALGSSRREVLEQVWREPLETPPGTVARYSDLGFILLGDFIERTRGRALDALFTDEIAGPAGVDTRFGPLPPELRSRCAPCEGLQGVVHDENARAMGGVAGHAGLFSTARDVSRLVAAWVEAWHADDPRVREFWRGSDVPGSTWCLGWDRPSAQGSSAGTRWPRDGVGHLGFTGTSIWIDPPRRRWVVLLSNRVEPTRENEKIKQLRPALHDLVVETLG